MCQSNAGRKVRFDGNSDELIELAKVNAMALGAGHTFVIFIDEGFPVGDEQHRAALSVYY